MIGSFFVLLLGSVRSYDVSDALAAHHAHKAAFGRQQGARAALRDAGADERDADEVVPPPRVTMAQVLVHLAAQNDGEAAGIVRAAARGRCRAAAAPAAAARAAASRRKKPASASYLPPPPPQPLLRLVLELMHEYDTFSALQLERLGGLVRAGDCAGLLDAFGGTRVTGARRGGGATGAGGGAACVAPPPAANAGIRDAAAIAARPRRSANGLTLRVHYSGYYEGGERFDTSRSAGRKPFQFVLGTGGVIKGWEIGMQGMCEGERRTLRIPKFLAYGKDVMIFDVELLDVRTAAEVAEVRARRQARAEAKKKKQKKKKKKK